MGDQLISEYLKEKVLNINKGQMIRLAFSHICFIFEIMSIQTKAHFTHQFFKNIIKEKKGSKLELYYMEILERRMRQKFEVANKASHNEKLDYMSIIDFDDNIQDCKNILFQQLIKVGEFYEYLCSHVLVLQDLFNKSTELINQNQVLIKMFHDLFQTNPHNPELQFLAAVYTSILDFEDRKFSCFTSKYEQNQIKKAQQKLRQYFSNDSCVIFSTFMKKIITIQKVSKQFSNIFKYDNSYIKDMSINTIIPKYFQSDHEEILDFFRNNGQMSIIEQGQRLVFGLDGEGFIIPLMIQLKIESGINDFGVSALFSRINHTKDYIFLSNDNQILDMTQNIFNIISSFTQRQINDLRLNSILQLIPLIWITEEAQEYNIEYQSILVLQKNYLNEFNGNNYFSHTKRENIKQILRAVQEQNDTQFYNISFKHCIFKIKSLDKTYKYIEINKIYKENKQSILDVSLLYLSRSLNDLIAKKNIQSKEQQQLRQFQRNQEGDSIKTFSTIENSDNKNDWGSPNSHRRSINKLQKKNNLSQFALNDQIQAQKQENKNITKSRNLSKDLFISTKFESISNQIENSAIQTDRLESNRIQNMSFQNDQTGYESNHNFKIINHIDHQSENIHLDLNRSAQQIKHLDPSQSYRYLMDQHQESFTLSPTVEQHFSFLSPRNNNTSSQNLSQHQINSPLRNNSNNFQIQTQIKKVQQNRKSQSNLQKIEEKSNKNSNKYKNLEEQIVQQLINDEETSQRQQVQNNSSSSSQDLENEETSQNSSQKRSPSIKSEGQQKKMVSNDYTNQKPLNFVDQYKQNLRKYSLGMEMNLQNNLVQEEQIIIQNKNDYSSNKQKSLINGQTLSDNSQFQNLVSLKVINEENDQTHNSPKIFVDSLKQNQDINNQYNEQNKDNMSIEDNIGNEKDNDDDLENSDDMRIEQQLRRSLSQSSKISSNYQQKKSIVQKIKSKRIAGVVLILTLMSFFSFLMFLTITVLMYFDSTQSLTQFKSVLSFMDKPVFVIIDTLKIIKSTTFNLLVSQTFSTEYDENMCFKEGQLAKAEANSTLEDFRKIYIELHENMDYNNKVINYLGGHDITINLYTFGLPSEDDKKGFTETQLTMNQFSAIGIYFGNMYSFIKSFERYFDELYEDGRNQMSEEMNAKLIWNNLIEFTQQMTKFSEFVYDDTHIQFDNLKTLQINLVLIVCGVCCLSVFSILPLYVYKQHSREQILRLIGSFQPSLLSQQNILIEQALNFIELKYSSYKNQLNGSSKYFQNSFRFQQNSSFRIQQHSSLKFQQNSSFKHHQRSDKKNKTIKQNTLNQNIEIPSLQQLNKQQNRQINSEHQIKYKDQTAEKSFQINLPALNSKRNQQNSSTQFQLSYNGEKTKSSEQHLDLQPCFFQRNSNKRNRSIASFQRLRKFNIIALVLSLLTIGVLMIQPVLTIYFTSTFISEQQALIGEKSIIQFTLSQILQNVAPNYALFSEVNYGLNKPQNTVYFKYYTQIRTQNQKQVKDLQSLVDNFSQERRENTLFKNFYQQVINGNICDLKDNYNQFFKSNFTKDECERVSHGILKRGLIISIKGLFDMWNDFFVNYEIYSSDDWNNYQEHWSNLPLKISNVILEKNLFDINNLNTILIQSTEAVLSYQNQSQQNYEEYIQRTYDILFITQLIIILFTFFFSWIQLFKHFDTQLIQTKQIFTLFHISLLSQNTFIIQFFKENSYGIK